MRVAQALAFVLLADRRSMRTIIEVLGRVLSGRDPRVDPIHFRNLQVHRSHIPGGAHGIAGPPPARWLLRRLEECPIDDRPARQSLRGTRRYRRPPEPGS